MGAFGGFGGAEGVADVGEQEASGAAGGRSGVLGRAVVWSGAVGFAEDQVGAGGEVVEGGAGAGVAGVGEGRVVVGGAQAEGGQAVVDGAAGEGEVADVGAVAVVQFVDVERGGGGVGCGAFEEGFEPVGESGWAVEGDGGAGLLVGEQQRVVVRQEVCGVVGVGVGDPDGVEEVGSVVALQFGEGAGAGVDPDGGVLGAQQVAGAGLPGRG